MPNRRAISRRHSRTARSCRRIDLLVRAQREQLEVSQTRLSTLQLQRPRFTTISEKVPTDLFEIAKGSQCASHSYTMLLLMKCFGLLLAATFIGGCSVYDDIVVSGVNAGAGGRATAGSTTGGGNESGSGGAPSGSGPIAGPGSAAGVGGALGGQGAGGSTGSETGDVDGGISGGGSGGSTAVAGAGGGAGDGVRDSGFPSDGKPITVDAGRDDATRDASDGSIGTVCAPDACKRVFVSAAPKPNGRLGSLAATDADCQSAAAAA